MRRSGKRMSSGQAQTVEGTREEEEENREEYSQERVSPRLTRFRARVGGGSKPSSIGRSRDVAAAGRAEQPVDGASRPVSGDTCEVEPELLRQLRKDLEAFDKVSREENGTSKSKDLERITRAVTTLGTIRQGSCLAQVIILACQVLDRNLSKFPGTEMAAAVALFSVLSSGGAADEEWNKSPLQSPSSRAASALNSSTRTKRLPWSKPPSSASPAAAGKSSPLPALAMEAAAESLRTLALSVRAGRMAPLSSVGQRGGVVGWQGTGRRENSTTGLAVFLVKEAERCRGKSGNPSVDHSIDGVLAELRGRPSSAAGAATRALVRVPASATIVGFDTRSGVDSVNFNKPVQSSRTRGWKQPGTKNVGPELRSEAVFGCEVGDPLPPEPVSTNASQLRKKRGRAERENGCIGMVESPKVEGTHERHEEQIEKRRRSCMECASRCPRKGDVKQPNEIAEMEAGASSSARGKCEEKAAPSTISGIAAAATPSVAMGVAAATKDATLAEALMVQAASENPSDTAARESDSTDKKDREECFDPNADIAQESSHADTDGRHNSSMTAFLQISAQTAGCVGSDTAAAAVSACRLHPPTAEGAVDSAADGGSPPFSGFAAEGDSGEKRSIATGVSKRNEGSIQIGVQQDVREQCEQDDLAQLTTLKAKTSDRQTDGFIDANRESMEPADQVRDVGWQRGRSPTGEVAPNFVGNAGGGVSAGCKEDGTSSGVNAFETRTPSMKTNDAVVGEESSDGNAERVCFDDPSSPTASVTGAVVHRGIDFTTLDFASLNDGAKTGGVAPLLRRRRRCLLVDSTSSVGSSGSGDKPVLGSRSRRLPPPCRWSLYDGSSAPSTPIPSKPCMDREFRGPLSLCGEECVNCTAVASPRRSGPREEIATNKSEDRCRGSCERIHDTSKGGSNPKSRGRRRQEKDWDSVNVDNTHPGASVPCGDSHALTDDNSNNGVDGRGDDSGSPESSGEDVDDGRGEREVAGGREEDDGVNRADGLSGTGRSNPRQIECSDISLLLFRGDPSRESDEADEKRDERYQSCDGGRQFDAVEQAQPEAENGPVGAAMRKRCGAAGDVSLAAASKVPMRNQGSGGTNANFATERKDGVEAGNSCDSLPQRQSHIGQAGKTTHRNEEEAALPSDVGGEESQVVQENDSLSILNDAFTSNTRSSFTPQQPLPAQQTDAANVLSRGTTAAAAYSVAASATVLLPMAGETRSSEPTDEVKGAVGPTRAMMPEAPGALKAAKASATPPNLARQAPNSFTVPTAGVPEEVGKTAANAVLSQTSEFPSASADASPDSSSCQNMQVFRVVPDHVAVCPSAPPRTADSLRMLGTGPSSRKTRSAPAPKRFAAATATDDFNPAVERAAESDPDTSPRAAVGTAEGADVHRPTLASAESGKSTAVSAALGVAVNDASDGQPQWGDPTPFASAPVLGHVGSDDIANQPPPTEGASLMSVLFDAYDGGSVDSLAQQTTAGLAHLEVAFDVGDIRTDHQSSNAGRSVVDGIDKTTVHGMETPHLGTFAPKNNYQQQSEKPTPIQRAGNQPGALSLGQRLPDTYSNGGGSDMLDGSRGTVSAADMGRNAVGAKAGGGGEIVNRFQHSKEHPLPWNAGSTRSRTASPNPSVGRCGSGRESEARVIEPTSPASCPGSTASNSTKHSFGPGGDAAPLSVTSLMHIDIEAAVKNDTRALRVLEVDSVELRNEVLNTCEVVGSFSLLGWCQRRCLIDVIFERTREAVVAVEMIESLALKSRAKGRHIKTLLKPAAFDGGTYFTVPVPTFMQRFRYGAALASPRTPLAQSTVPPSQQSAATAHSSMASSVQQIGATPVYRQVDPQISPQAASPPLTTSDVPTAPASGSNLKAEPTSAESLAAAAAAVAKQVAAAAAMPAPSLDAPTNLTGLTDGVQYAGGCRMKHRPPARTVSPINVRRRDDASERGRGGAAQQWLQGQRPAGNGSEGVGTMSRWRPINVLKASPTSWTPGVSGTANFAVAAGTVVAEAADLGALAAVGPVVENQDALKQQAWNSSREQQVAALNQQQIQLRRLQVQQQQGLLRRQRREIMQCQQRLAANLQRGVLEKLKQRHTQQLQTQQLDFLHQQQRQHIELQHRLHMWNHSTAPSLPTSLFSPSAIVTPTAASSPCGISDGCRPTGQTDPGPETGRPQIEALALSTPLTSPTALLSSPLPHPDSERYFPNVPNTNGKERSEVKTTAEGVGEEERKASASACESDLIGGGDGGGHKGTGSEGLAALKHAIPLSAGESAGECRGDGVGGGEQLPADEVLCLSSSCTGGTSGNDAICDQRHQKTSVPSQKRRRSVVNTPLYGNPWTPAGSAGQPAETPQENVLPSTRTMDDGMPVVCPGSVVGGIGDQASLSTSPEQMSVDRRVHQTRPHPRSAARGQRQPRIHQPTSSSHQNVGKRGVSRCAFPRQWHQEALRQLELSSRDQHRQQRRRVGHPKCTIDPSPVSSHYASGGLEPAMVLASDLHGGRPSQAAGDDATHEGNTGIGSTRAGGNDVSVRDIGSGSDGCGGGGWEQALSRVLLQTEHESNSEPPRNQRPGEVLI